MQREQAATVCSPASFAPFALKVAVASSVFVELDGHVHPPAGLHERAVLHALHFAEHDDRDAGNRLWPATAKRPPRRRPAASARRA